MIVVVDASVALKWVVEEPDSRVARAWLASGHVLVAPVHVVGEVGEVLCRRARDEVIAREQVAAAFAFFRHHVLLMPLPDLLDGAAEVSIATGIAFYDALYVALAVRHGSFVVTADRRLLRLTAGSAWQERAVDFTGSPPP